MATELQTLVAVITGYVTSGGKVGTIADIKARWTDFSADFANQYASEHAGLHQQLRELRDQVVNSPEYSFLRNLSQVNGLSAHYSPAQLERELAAQFEAVGVSHICDRVGALLRLDLDSAWGSSSCGYKVATPVTFDSAALQSKVVTGTDEYLQFIRGCSAELKDYVADHPEAAPLLELLNAPLPASVVRTLEDPEMRDHLGAALAEAKAVKISLEEFLNLSTPLLLGYFQNANADLKKRLIAAVDSYVGLKRPDITKPWKLE
jgi:hypothetical protein